MTVTLVEAPWEAYAAGSEIEHFAAFCEAHCRQSVDDWEDEPLRLESFQLRMLGEALAFDSVGMPVWRRVALVLPRKQGKTTLLAAFALYRLLTMDGSPEILLAATTDKQAQRLFQAAASFVARDETLRGLVTVRDYKGEIVRNDGKGTILRVSAQSTDLDGYNPTLVVVDELHNWETPGEKKTFAKLVSGGGARGNRRQMFTITTAGEAQTRDSSILGRMLDGSLARGSVERVPGLEVARNHAAATLVYNYTAPTRDPRDVEAMKLANPASWITLDFLREAADADDLTTEEVLRYHGGVWADAAEAWIKRPVWGALRVVGCAAPRGSEVFIGVDAASTSDCTAVGWAWRVPGSDRIGVGCHVIAAKTGNAAHEYAPGGVIDVRKLRTLIPALADRNGWEIREVCYDRVQFESVALDLSDEHGLVVSDAWSAPQHRSQAWTHWYGAVQNGVIAHDGDAVLEEHVTGAQARMTEYGWKVEKLRQRRAQKIDALVACAIAAWRCSAAPSGGYAFDVDSLDDDDAGDPWAGLFDDAEELVDA